MRDASKLPASQGSILHCTFCVGTLRILRMYTFLARQWATPLGGILTLVENFDSSLEEYFWPMFPFALLLFL